MEYLQEITLDLNTNTAYTTIGAKQSDNGSRTIRVYLTQNGQDYNLVTNGVQSAYYRLHKPDGKAVINAVNIDRSGDFLEMVFTAQGLAVPGRAYCDIVLQSGSQILSTVSFILVIMAAPAIAEQLVSGNEFGFLTALVNDATVVVQDAEAWAAGTRGGDPVIGTQTLSATENSSAISSVSVSNMTNFFNQFGHVYGGTREFEFVYQANGTWILTITTKQGTRITTSDSEVVTSLTQYGITISYLAGATNPNIGDTIIITLKEPDPSYENNAKYYSEIAAASAALIDNIPAVKYETQSLTSAQKTIARNNIGAQPSGNYQPAGDYIAQPSLPNTTQFLRYNVATSSWECADISASAAHAMPSILTSTYYGDELPLNPAEGQLFFLRVQDD